MKSQSLTLTVLLAFASLGPMAACDDASGIKETPPQVDSGASSTSSSSSSGDSGMSDCFENPTTHFEIINACTTATKITKNPTLNKILADGGLPTPM